MSTPERFEHEDLREGDLLAYLEGEAPPAAARHIAACPLCRAELSGLRAADALLSAALARADCPAPELLLRYQAGLLGAEEAGALAAHLATCADCTAELLLLETPPTPSAAGSLARAGGRLLKALLQPAAPPALALRGEGPSARQAVYAVEGYQLLLATMPGRPATGPAQLEGQLLAPGATATGTARLWAGEAAVAEAEVDELGFFAFDGVTPGSYTLTLDLGADRIIVESLAVP
jgi:anti-sigma factor RsiW